MEAYNFSLQNTRFDLSLPNWAIAAPNELPSHLPILEDRMAAVIDFSRRNFIEGTGGPFAAGVFERDTGKLVVIGVNCVVPLNCSAAHAEIVALSLAQAMLGTHDLGAEGLPAYQLVASWQPCAMCAAAVPWSGVRSLVVGGRGPELEAGTGLDKGPTPPGWRAALERQGIEVIEGVLYEEARAVFREFASGQTSEVFRDL